MQKVSVSPSNGIVFFKKTFSSQKCITRAKTSHPIESVLFAKWVVLFEQLQGKKNYTHISSVCLAKIHSHPRTIWLSYLQQRNSSQHGRYSMSTAMIKYKQKWAWMNQNLF